MSEDNSTKRLYHEVYMMLSSVASHGPAALTDTSDPQYTAGLLARLRDAIASYEARYERQVRSVSEMESLPVGTVVLTEQGGIWQAVHRDRFSLVWYEPGHGGLGARAAELTLPAQVIYTPREADRGKS